MTVRCSTRTPGSSSTTSPGPYIPDSDVPPIWNPEFFANTMVVNGRTWPVLEVEPRRYRFRLLNGCNSRFLHPQARLRPDDQARGDGAADVDDRRGGRLPA